MNYIVGQTVKTVYGEREVIKVNKASVLVNVDGNKIKVGVKQLEIMN